MFDQRIISVDNNAQIETAVLLSQRKADDYVEVELELDELDLTSADRSGAQTLNHEFISIHIEIC